MKSRLLNLMGVSLGVLLGLFVLGLLAGCSGAPRWGAWSKRPSPAQIQAVLGRQESYVYIPAYEVYYNGAAARYVFWDGGDWVSTREPPYEVSLEELLTAPSVVMDFQDHPARHHAAVVRRYPRDWQRPAPLLASAR